MHFAAKLLPQVFVLCTTFVVASKFDTRQNGPESKNLIIKQYDTKTKTTPAAEPRRNISYLDVSQNIRRPYDNERMEQNHNKMKKKKKSPTRTIQKIIKKHSMKNRRLYNRQVTSVTSKATMDAGRKVMMEDDSSVRDVAPSTQSALRKKPRKWNKKVGRYPMPFHQFQSRKLTNGQRRAKRTIEKDNNYIIQDLDEVQFIGNGNDYDTVNVHVKNYW